MAFQSKSSSTIIHSLVECCSFVQLAHLPAIRTSELKMTRTCFEQLSMFYIASFFFGPIVIMLRRWSVPRMCHNCVATVRKSSNVNELCARLPFKSTFGPFSNEVDSKNWATVGMRNASKPQMNNCLPGSLSTTFGVLSTTSCPGVSVSDPKPF